MVLSQDVFITAMNLMDQTTTDGTFTGYPDEYKKRSWPVLTLLQAELLGPNVVIPTILSERDSVAVDDRTARTVLPYGLAAHLMLTEDPNLATFFNNRYDELKRKRMVKIVKITDVYGVQEGSTGTSTDTSTDIHIVVDGGVV